MVIGKEMQINKRLLGRESRRIITTHKKRVTIIRWGRRPGRAYRSHSHVFSNTTTIRAILNYQLS